MKLYTLKDYEQISKTGIGSNISDTTMDIINILVNQVGAPEYSKTPQFKNKQHTLNRRKVKKNLDVNDCDWDVLRTFKATERIQKEGIDKTIDTLRKLLNKLTKNNYDELFKLILEELNRCDEETDNVEDKNNNFCIIATEILNISSNNILYSETYADLYKNLSSKYAIFNQTLVNSINNNNSSLYTINYCSPETNYDSFCDNNKNNETRRAKCLFYVNLCIINLLDENVISEIILKCIKLLTEYIYINNKSNEVDEISEILYTMTSRFTSHMSPTLYTKLHKQLTEISELKPQFYPSLSNKCIFKFMDILDDM
jgi:hypothetical protein